MVDRKKPSTPEDEYFAREEAEKMRRLALERQRHLKETEREALRKLHWMRCPKCGDEMQTVRFREVDIEKCFNCGYVGLDEGELEKIVAAEGGTVTRAVLNIFKGK